MAFDPQLLASWCGGKWRPSPPGKSVSGFSFDTRSLVDGDMFVAIKSDRRDGHDFIANAQQHGAAGALTSEYRISETLPQLETQDSLEAYRKIASEYRKTWDATVVAITGSCGKTTAKDLLKLILGEAPVVHGTNGNFNNLIGVPGEILRADAEQVRFAVLEAGISEPGEMASLGETIQPDIVVFTAIGASHLEGLGDIDSVAREKALLASAGNARKAYLGETAEPYAETLFSGERIIVKESDETVDGQLSYKLEYEGGSSILSVDRGGGLERYSYNGIGKALASNVALAVAVARDLGINEQDIQERLKLWKPSSMRGEWMEMQRVSVLLDCYNANPLSMGDSIETFIVMSKGDRPRLYILGCMEELGEASPLWHARLGRELPLREMDCVYVVGTEGKSVIEGLKEAGRPVENAHMISEVSELPEEVGNFEGDVFIKGSRRYRLEEALQKFAASCEKEARC